MPFRQKNACEQAKNVVGGDKKQLDVALMGFFDCYALNALFEKLAIWSFLRSKLLNAGFWCYTHWLATKMEL